MVRKRKECNMYKKGKKEVVEETKEMRKKVQYLGEKKRRNGGNFFINI